MIFRQQLCDVKLMFSGKFDLNMTNASLVKITIYGNNCKFDKRKILYKQRHAPYGVGSKIQ